MFPLYLGVCAADYGSRYPTLTKRTVLALLGAMAAGITILLVCYYRCHEYLYPYGLLWWPFILIVPGLCLLLSWLSMLVERTAPIVIRFLRYVGGCTLEIYIVHMFVFHAARVTNAGIFYGTDKRWLLITAASLCLPFWHLPLLPDIKISCREIVRLHIINKENNSCSATGNITKYRSVWMALAAL